MKSQQFNSNSYLHRIQIIFHYDKKKVRGNWDYVSALQTITKSKKEERQSSHLSGSAKPCRKKPSNDVQSKFTEELFWIDTSITFPSDIL